MDFQFYIIKTDIAGNEERVYFTPESEELKNAQNSAEWGMKKGIVSLVNTIRTSTTYWEAI